MGRLRDHLVSRGRLILQDEGMCRYACGSVGDGGTRAEPACLPVSNKSYGSGSSVQSWLPSWARRSLPAYQLRNCTPVSRVQAGLLPTHLEKLKQEQEHVDSAAPSMQTMDK